MKLAVIGTGYVGLVAGAGFADFGSDVCCVDVDTERVELLRRGEVPIHEPGLPDLVRQNSAAGRLRFTTSIAEAVSGAEVVLIAVGTPTSAAGDGSADLGAVLAAAEEIGAALSGYAVIVDKSTVPVGTAERVRDAVARRTAQPFSVVSNPEFLKEGSAVEDFLRPMRVIIGVGPASGPGPDHAAQDERARTVMRRLYDPVVRTNDRLLFTDARSAEMTKYAANAYLATRISFMNDIAALCERVGADVEAVRRGMGMDSRIGPKFLFPGIGFGGSCFPKDLRALQATARAEGLELSLLRAADAINERQKVLLAERVRRHLGGEGGDLAGRTVALWGLAFKPGTDDLREAPALALLERLLRLGASVRATDPVALPAAERHLVAQRAAGRVTLLADPYEAARGADALILCTEWRQYRQPDFRRLRALMAGDGIFDGRNLWDPGQVRELGFSYCGVGRR